MGDRNASYLTLAILPDGRTLAAGTLRGDVELWDPASGNRRSTLRAHSAAVTQLVFDPGGRALISAGEDGTIRLWRPGQK